MSIQIVGPLRETNCLLPVDPCVAVIQSDFFNSFLTSSSSVPFFFVVPVCQSSHPGCVRLCVLLGILPWVPILLDSLCSSNDQIDPAANSGLKWLYPQHNLPALPGERWLTLSVNDYFGPRVLQTSGSFVFLGFPYSNLFFISKKWEVTRELSQIPQLDWQTMYCCACCYPRLVLPVPSSLSRNLPVPVVLRVTLSAALLLTLPNSARCANHFLLLNNIE